MFILFLTIPFSIIAGQVIVRLATKVSLPSPVVLAAKTLVAILFVDFMFRAADKDDGKNNNNNLVWKTIIPLLFLCLGLWIGESFRPITLTGSIATGKSTVAQMLLAGDVVLIDSDSIGHEILLPPSVLSAPTKNSDKKDDTDKKYTVFPSESVYDSICEAFPEDKASFLDPDSQMIIRRKLGAVIFSNDRKRRTLNSITHPRIIQILLKRIMHAIYIQQAPICCADVPLLFESGMLRYLFCLVLVVATKPDIQYQRLRQRNTDLTEEDCRNRIQSQYPVERKVAGADIVIWNNGSVEELENQVKQVKATVKHRLHGGMPMYVLVFVGGLVRLLVGKIY